ncbi:hypothetical protein EVAR_59291_1 [Eumeta japonica]|uniref:Uncharacterized protein n=1 Tax=Eumeta variegata TaxID=151549 RepID=A0A4C1Y980_EUMVA|nr:hypothetical protein EVAR_59291_1 [Eumeta japonica]
MHAARLASNRVPFLRTHYSPHLCKVSLMRDAVEPLVIGPVVACSRSAKHCTSLNGFFFRNCPYAATQNTNYGLNKKRTAVVGVLCMTKPGYTGHKSSD